MKRRQINKKNVKPENVFTIATARALSIDEVNAVIRNAIHRANGRHRKTIAYWYHNGRRKDRDRHFHILFTRDMEDKERVEISNSIKNANSKKNWGRSLYLEHWGCGYIDEDTKKETTTAYLAEHKHCIRRNVRR